MKRIGSSDVASILGIGFRDPQSIWEEKVLARRGYFIGDDKAPVDSPALQVGNVLENSVIDWAASKVGIDVRKNQLRVSKSYKWASASFDALSKDDTIAIEAKTAGIASFLSRDSREEWGEELSDQIPPRYLVQCFHQLNILPSVERIFVAALVGGRGLCLFKVEREGNEYLIDGIFEKLRQFWEFHVLKNTPPRNEPLSLDALRALPREEGKKIALPDDSLMDAYLAKSAALRHAESEADTAKRALIEALGDAEIGQTADGREVSYKSQARRSVDTKALRIRYPQIAAEFERVSTTRTVRVRGAAKMIEQDQPNPTKEIEE